MQLMCLRSKSILYTLLCDVRAGFCKQGFLASGFLLLCDKGGTQRTTELEEKGEWSFFPFFFFLSVGLLSISQEPPFLSLTETLHFLQKQLN